MVVCIGRKLKTFFPCLLGHHRSGDSLVRAGDGMEIDEPKRDGMDADEPILSMIRGSNSIPWHPGQMSAPYIYKICLLGACGAGKSSIAHRLVTHTFDPNCKPTRSPAQLFWRHFEQSTGLDIMVELEDTPGVQAETLQSGELKPEGLAEVAQLLRPLVWFEKRRRDVDVRGAANAPDESQPLLPSGAPRVTSAIGGKKAKRESTGFAGLSKAASALKDDLSRRANEAFGSSGVRSNPIGEDRKRMGFLVVADVSSVASFDAAYAIIDRIFDRLQFDVNDPITCPVSIVIVGNKSDLRGHLRQVEPEAELRAEILSRYENMRADPPHSVLYVECSAQTNEGLEEVRETNTWHVRHAARCSVFTCTLHAFIPKAYRCPPGFFVCLAQVMLMSLARIRKLPPRHRIRTARLRANGYFAQCKRSLFTICPFCFDVEELCKYVSRQLIKPVVKKLGLYSIVCECAPLLKVFRALGKIWSRLLTFRWLCDWCPPFVLRLRKEVTAEEEDAADEQDKGGGDDDDDEV